MSEPEEDPVELLGNAYEVILRARNDSLRAAKRTRGADEALAKSRAITAKAVADLRELLDARPA